MKNQCPQIETGVSLVFGLLPSHGGIVGVSFSGESVTLSALTSTTNKGTTKEYEEVYAVFAEDYNEEGVVVVVILTKREMSRRFTTIPLRGIV